MALVSEFPFAYIPNTADGTVSVIDTRSNTVRTTIAVGAAPRGVAAVPGGNVYVTNSGDDTVSVINSATRQVVHTINLGAAKQPLGVVVTPDGSQIWVGNTGNSTVSVIETVNYSVQETYDVYYPPAGLALTPDGSYLYVATGSEVCVIYTLASGVQNQVTLAWPEPEPLAGSQASGLAMTPDGTQVWVADSANGVVWVIDTARNEVAGPPIQVGGFSLSGPWGVAVTPDQGKVFVTNYSLQSYSVISIAPPPAPPTESTAQNYNLSGNDEPSPAAVSVTPDGNFAYITGGQPLQAHGCVWVISTASNEVVGQPVEVGGTTDALPFGQFIAVPELEIVREPIRPGL